MDAGQNYCGNPLIGTELEWFGWTATPDEIPLENCQGDCDYNSDCRDGLVCYEDKVPPGCTGELFWEAASPTHYGDYCGYPTISGQTEIFETFSTSLSESLS